ncbi:MAG: NAD(P)H-dependent oxidoreductase [Candidatus Krumholzibacteriota bacterium]|nr:NAD(P)H-dependent oxidoreductase [Candidatus Krumholzibacteriota bacterium]
MHVYVVFSHPSRRSFTFEVLSSFLRGLQEAGHSYELGDLYQMNFSPAMDLAQYQRETGNDSDAPVPADVKKEQEKIDRAEGLVFIYPVWWSDCPATLKGWFDRVLSYGYAYTYEEGEHVKSRIDIKKGLVICPAGHTADHLEETGIAESMRKVMLQDRLLGVGVREARMEILGGMVLQNDRYREENLRKAYLLGKEF